jgi:phospholipid/cholesterol/gamma-HCH transport system substrate-binding protein
VPEDSSVAVATEGLLGATFVEVVPGGSPFALEPGMAIEDTQGALSLIGLLAQFVNAASGD